MRSFASGLHPLEPPDEHDPRRAPPARDTIIDIPAPRLAAAARPALRAGSGAPKEARRRAVPPVAAAPRPAPRRPLEASRSKPAGARPASEGRRAPAAVVAAPRPGRLLALISQPGSPACELPLDQPLTTLDEVAALGAPGRPSLGVALRTRGEEVFLECAPRSQGVVLGGVRVYRAILRPGDRFEIGEARVAIARRGAAPARSASDGADRADRGLGAAPPRPNDAPSLPRPYGAPAASGAIDGRALVLLDRGARAAEPAPLAPAAPASPDRGAGSPVTEAELCGPVRCEAIPIGPPPIGLSHALVPAGPPLALVRAVLARAVDRLRDGGQPLPVTAALATATTADPWLQAARPAARIDWRHPRLRRALVAAAVLLGLGLVVRTRLTVVAECEIAPGSRAFVRAAVAGRIVEVHVREGSQVHPGDRLVSLAVPEVERDLRRIGHELAQVRAIAIAVRERHRAASDRLTSIEARRAHLAGLVRRGFESRLALQGTDDAVSSARVEESAAAESLEVQKAALAKLLSDRDYLEEQRAGAEITSTSAGVVATAHPEELVARQVAPGDELLLVLDGQQMQFEARVPEKEIEFVRVGAKVRIRLKGDPEHPVEGVVEQISPRAVDGGPLGKVVPVRCRTRSVPAASLAGLTGTTEIEGPSATWMGVLIKRAHRWFRTDVL